MNTTEFLYIATAICPDRPFIVFEGRQWSFVQFNERVNRLANAFRELGIQQGDRIGMLQVNCPPYVEAYFAAAKIGAIFVPLNIRAQSEELVHLIGNAEAAVLLTGARYFDMVKEMLPQLPGDMGVPILIVQHMPPIFTQSLASSLSSSKNQTSNRFCLIWKRPDTTLVCSKRESANASL